MILATTLLQITLAQPPRVFRNKNKGPRSSKEVTDAQRFGVAEVYSDRVIAIEEKPKNPKSNYAVTGVYFYDASVFQKIRRLKPSRRGELEITDVNNFYLQEGALTYEFLRGWWTDAGTFESLLRANMWVAQTGANKTAKPVALPSQELAR